MPTIVKDGCFAAPTSRPSIPAARPSERRVPHRSSLANPRGRRANVRRPLAWAPLAEPRGQATRSTSAGHRQRDGRLARLEAVLFLAREPLPTRKLAQLASLADGTEARTLVRRLNAFYDLAHSTLWVAEVAGGFRLLTRPEFGTWLPGFARARPIAVCRVPRGDVGGHRVSSAGGASRYRAFGAFSAARCYGN